MILQIQKLLPSGDINCTLNKKAILLCCNDKCMKPALICQDQNCSCLKDNHKKCQFIQIYNIINKINSKKRETPNQIKDAINDLVKIYSDLIDQLSKDRESLQIWAQNFGLSSKQYQLAKKLNLNLDTNLINGSFVSSIIKNIKNNNQFLNFTKWRVHTTWMSYKDKINSMINQFHLSFDGFQIDNFDQNVLSKAFAENKIRETHQQKNLIDHALKNQWIQITNFAETKSSFNQMKILKLRGTNQGKNLQWRTISTDFNQIPCQIKALKSLQQLAINGHLIRKINNLQTFVHLRILNLSYNKIQRIKKLKSLEKLEVLYLNNNKIQKIQNLNILPNLTYVTIFNNPAIKIKDEKLQIIQINQFPGQIQRLKNKNVRVVEAVL